MPTERIVAFLDILGCSAIATDGTADEKQNILDYLKLINQTYLSNLGVVVRNLGVGEQIIHNPEVFACSDSILLSADTTGPGDFEQSQIISNLMSTMISIFWQGIHAGLLIRGGVARGECTHNSNQIFGAAYVSAVNLEKDTKYPRVEFDATVFHEDRSPILDEDSRALCVKEIEGRKFLNTLGWHQGTWNDYFFFKYGQSEWPKGEYARSEIIDEIERIDQMIVGKLSTLAGSPLEKWRWFSSHWEDEKVKWPIFA